MVELLISLITVSIIVSAFAPVIQKKIHAGKKTFSQVAGITKNCASKVNSNCKLCFKEGSEYKCLKCGLTTLEKGKFVDNSTCTLKSCIANCTSCNNGTKCIKCKEGYGLSEDSKCVTCPVGTYSNGTNCTPCAPGTYSNSTAQAKCTGCSSNTYQANSGSTSCITCTNGTVTSDKKTCNCNGGYYKNKDGVCTICPAGSYCANNTKQSCGTGKFSNSGASTCSTCTAGYSCTGGIISTNKCPAGTYSNNGSCIPCPQGTYSNGGTSSCTKCPDGWVCANGLLSVTQGGGCKEGYYIYQSKCVQCSANAICKGGNSGVQTQCSSGTYYYNGSCITCPAGYRCSGGVKYACSSGQYSNSGASSCLSCPAGYTCPDGILMVCPQGMYSQNNKSKCNLKCSDKYGEKCITCDASKCNFCAEGYELFGKKCLKHPSSQADCNKYNAIYTGNNTCMTKYNAGDSGGPTIPSGVSIKTATSGAAGSSYHENKYCWKGTTGGMLGLCDNVNGYSGCTRTVCTFPAASAICANLENTYKDTFWRIPVRSSFTSAGMLNLCGINLGENQGKLTKCDFALRCATAAVNAMCAPHITWAFGASCNGTKCFYLGAAVDGENGNIEFKDWLPNIGASTRCELVWMP